MKTKTKIIVIALLTLISVSCFLNSCSLIGFGIGAAVDSKTPETTRLSHNQIDTLEFGKRVEITKYNGDTVCGKFKGILPIYCENFHKEYDSIKSALFNQVQLPDLNDTLLILCSGKNNLKKLGLFKGFESQTLWCEYVYGEDFFNVYLASIKGIKINNEYYIDSAPINSYFLKTRFPNFLHIQIDLGKKQIEEIELTSINKIVVTDKRNRKFIGLGIGLAVDLVVAFIVADSNFSPGEGLSLY